MDDKITPSPPFPGGDVSTKQHTDDTESAKAHLRVVSSQNEAQPKLGVARSKIISPLAQTNLSRDELYKIACVIDASEAFGPRVGEDNIKALIQNAYRRNKQDAFAIHRNESFVEDLKYAMRKLGAERRLTSAGRSQIKCQSITGVEYWKDIDDAYDNCLRAWICDKFVRVWTEMSGKGENARLILKHDCPYFIQDKWAVVMGELENFNRVITFNADYLSNVTHWDGAERLKNLIASCFGELKPNAQRLAEWIVPAAFRAMVLRNTNDDGYKFDHMPVLFGAGDTGKSTFISQIVPKGPGYDPAWHVDSLVFGDSRKEFVEKTNGAVVGEYAECEDMSETNFGHIKAVQSCVVDTVRLSFRRDAATYVRRVVPWGTSNEPVLPLGKERRFIPIDLGESRQNNYERITKYFSENRDQLWAEAKHLARAEHEYYNTIPEDLKDLVYREAAKQSPSKEILDTYKEWLATRKDGFERAIPISEMPEELGYDDSRKNEISKILQNYGVVAKNKSIEGKTQKCLLIKK